MEQKQLDEMEESFFEEFVDDEPLAFEDLEKLGQKGEADDLGVEEARKAKKVFTRSAAKKSEKKANSKKEGSKREEAEAKKVDDLKVEMVKDEVEIKPAKELGSLQEGRDKSAGKWNEKAGEKASKAKEVHEHVDEHSNEHSNEHVKEEPLDPWSKEKESSDMFKDVSTWKAITGVAVLLLVISLFTQGFNFSANSLTGASVAALSLSEAEEKVADYVNNYLLQPPFVAEIESSEELDDLYKITLSVAGQVVDSYLTKDGQLFFPQGFKVEGAELDFAAPQQTSPPSQASADSADNDPVADDNPVLEDGASSSDKPSSSDKSDEPADKESGLEESKETQEVEDVITIPLNAKKWVFAPEHVDVNKGEIVRLTLLPQGLDFTFAIPELGIEKEVSGQTVVEFKASKVGTFQFECSSCEDWRGMTGTLTVK